MYLKFKGLVVYYMSMEGVSMKTHVIASNKIFMDFFQLISFCFCPFLDVRFVLIDLKPDVKARAYYAYIKYTWQIHNISQDNKFYGGY